MNAIVRIMRRTKTWLAIVAGTGVLVAILIAKWKGDGLDDDPVYHELFRFSLTVVVGGVIAFVFRMAEAKRQVRDIRQRELRDFYRRMLSAYNEAKKVRRLLYARSREVDGSVEISRKALDDLMAGLESAQLDIESLRRETEATRKLFPDNGAVESHLSRAEKSLRGVLKVYESMDPTVEAARMPVGDFDFRKLLCFFYNQKELAAARVPDVDCKSFDSEFSDEIHAVRRLIVGTTEEVAADD